MDKWIAAQTALVDIVYDLANEMNQEVDYEAIEMNTSLMESLTTIIKRMGESNIYGSMAMNRNNNVDDTKEGE